MLTAGSDDHSGTYTATAFTKTPLASSVDEYLAYIRRGEHEPTACGGSVLMGHAFYHIAYSITRTVSSAATRRASRP